MLSWLTGKHFNNVVKKWEGSLIISAFPLMILDPFIFMFQIFIVCFVLGCIMNAAKIFAQQAADLTALRYVPKQ